MTKNDAKGLERYLSPLSAWALSFGCAVGWGVFIMPGTTFLPVAGPLGTLIGLGVGAVIMFLVGINYHFLIRRYPGAGGAYDYVKNVCGYDHGYLCAWFLILTYIAIVWANATALALIGRHLLGGFFSFGFRYHVAGYDVYAGEIFLSVAALVAIGAVLVCGKRLAARVQTFFAIALAVGIAVCVIAVFMRHEGGAVSLSPLFAKDENMPLQVLSIVALAPWAFVGFESISHSSGEFKFHNKLSIWVMVTALATAVAAYFSLTIVAASFRPSAFASWREYMAALGKLNGLENLPVFYAVWSAVGSLGTVLLCVAALAAIVTGLIGHVVAASRLLCSVARDGILPEWFAEIDGRGGPRNAIMAIVAVSCLIPFVGRTAVGWIVDVTTIGASTAYGYVSFCALRIAWREGKKFVVVSGVAGLLVSMAFVVYFLVPNFWVVAVFSTESYLILAAWSIAGVVFFRNVFIRDRTGRFGTSTISWISLLFFIFFSGHMWMRQATHNVTDSVVAQVGDRYVRSAEGVVPKTESEYLEHQKDVIDDALTRHNVVLMGLVVLVLAIMFNIYTTIARREKDAAKAKSYFFSTISHDIRTPLNAIVGFSQMLKLGFKTKSESDEAIDSILIGSKSLLAFVNDILDLSRRESGDAELTLLPTDCHALLRDVEEAFRVGTPKKGVEIRAAVAEMPHLLVDSLHLRHIVSNMVSNAVKFTEKGHVEVRGRFDLDNGREGDVKTGTLLIEIEDTGVGISEEDKAKIDSPYTQTESKIARNGGTGLSLAVCRQLVKEMGGTMSFDSELGKGSTFRVTLPNVEIAKVGSPNLEMEEKLEEESESVDVVDEAVVQASAAPAPSFTPRLLLVDDQKMNLTVLKAMIKRVGVFEIETAADGKEALSRLHNLDAPKISAVLTDMWMPELDGEGLAKAIRADASLAKLPVHVITADVELQENYAEKGFDSIILKPVTVNTLRHLLVGLAERKGKAA